MTDAPDGNIGQRLDRVVAGDIRPLQTGDGEKQLRRHRLPRPDQGREGDLPGIDHQLVDGLPGPLWRGDDASASSVSSCFSNGTWSLSKCRGGDLIALPPRGRCFFGDAVATGPSSSLSSLSLRIFFSCFLAPGVFRDFSQR